MIERVRTSSNVPVYAGWPVSSSQSIAPSENTSERASVRSISLFACSGGMYDGVPMTLPANVAESGVLVQRLFHSPKRS